MQGDVSDDELAQSIAAFAIPSIYSLIHIIYILAFGKRSSLLRPRPDWEILVLTMSMFLLGVAGICLALFAARTRDVRVHLGLKGVGLLSVEVLVVVIAGRRVFQIYRDVQRVYRNPKRPLPFDFLIAFGIGSHPLLLGLGFWQLREDGVEFIWVAPSTHHFVLFLLLISLYINWGYHRGWSWGWKQFGWWGVGFLTANLVAFVLPVVGVSLRGRWVHLSQCLSSFVVILLCDVRRWWIAGHSTSDESALRSLSGGTSIRQYGSDLEGSIKREPCEGTGV
ncbi:hypothetical protein VTI28DRAFT_5486 [Corynascus sepedonium]